MSESLREKLRPILSKLLARLEEIKQRENQPKFNKALDAKCDIDEALDEILALFVEAVEGMPLPNNPHIYPSRDNVVFCKGAAKERTAIVTLLKESIGEKT